MPDRIFLRRRRRALLALAASLVAACNLPRDSDGTLDRVRGGTMRVGYAVDTPWVTDSNGSAGGIEGQLVRDVARQLRANVQWVHGGQSELLQTLQHRELDLVIAGLTSSSPWRKQLAFTRPYYTDSVLVGGIAHGPPPTRLDGVAVAVKSGDPAIAALRKKGAKPVPLDKLDTASIAIAAPTWQLDQLGRTGNETLQLAANGHVLAASPGENAWLMAVERVLIRRQDGIARQLRAAQP